MDFTVTHAVFSLYLLVVFYLGWRGWKHTQSHADFILGGRKLGTLTTALSAGASDMSGWLLLGLPGLAYSIGMGSSWLAAGLLFGTWCNWMWVAPKLRKQSEQLNSLTIPTWLEHRFADHSHWLRVISAGFILVFFLFYTSSGLVAGAKLFEETFSMSYHGAVVFGALMIVSYTFFGGFLSVSWSDVLQALLMLAALVITPIFLWHYLHQNAELESHMRLRSDLWYFRYDAQGRPFSMIEIVSLCAWGLGYFGQPHILARFKAIKNPAALKQAKLIAISWTAFTLTGAILVGVLGAMVFEHSLNDSEKVFIALINTLFHPLVGGLLLAAILAAIMSTADSQLLISATAISEDLWPLLHKKNHTPLKHARITVVLLTLIAIAVAWQPDAGVLDLVSYAWAGFGAAFGPVILLGLHWSGVTRQGALAGIIVGGATVILWKPLSGGLFDLYEILPGFVFSTLTIVLVSKLRGTPVAVTR